MADIRVNEEEATERTPLVADAHHQDQPTARPGARPRASSIASFAAAVPKVPTVHDPQAIVLIICTIIGVVSMAGGFQAIAATRIFEDILCRKYYQGTLNLEEPIDEDLCKVDAIQSELAYLFAVSISITGLASALMAIPWGIAADR